MSYINPTISVSDLTRHQQELLYAALKLPIHTFSTSDIQARAKHTPDACAVGGAMGGLKRRGLIERVSGGRSKTWRIAPHVREQQASLTTDLWVALAQYEQEQPQPRRNALDELLERAGSR